MIVALSVLVGVVVVLACVLAWVIRSHQRLILAHMNLVQLVMSMGSAVRTLDVTMRALHPESLRQEESVHETWPPEEM